MASFIPGYEYDIFINYRQKDYKNDGWVTEFVNNPEGELEFTSKEVISAYFEINSHDGLFETHDVVFSSKEKLNILICRNNLMGLLIMFVMLLLAPESFAQTLRIKAGLNLSNMLVKDKNHTYSDDFKMKPGFNTEVTVEFPIKEVISFDMGLLLSTKGYKINLEDRNLEYKGTRNLLYFDIPLTAKVYFNAKGTKTYVDFGPYLGIGLSGKDKYEVTYNGRITPRTESIPWGSDEAFDVLKRLDFGLTAGAGVEINSIQIIVSYGFGLVNISSNTDVKIRNRVLGISLGYKFGGD